ncbi:lipocalin family protein [Novosphingobium sp. ZN18A2]|uniref:lipocalin family protein n=1 Tax=Novosphingobium sp. ZN18A2 TaxID=3079861 RepID=UPI0030D60C00
MSKATRALGLAAGLGAAAYAARALSRRHPVGNPSVPEPRKPVDIDRYLGKWFEIARYEQAFEKGCMASTAEYRRLPDGGIKVINTCRKPDLQPRVVTGKARVVDSETNAKLKVSFLGPLFTGDYWVLDHCDDYEWAIVGEPSGRFLWLLSRKQVLPWERAEALYDRAEALGYDTGLLVRTVQP